MPTAEPCVSDMWRLGDMDVDVSSPDPDPPQFGDLLRIFDDIAAAADDVLVDVTEVELPAPSPQLKLGPVSDDSMFGLSHLTRAELEDLAVDYAATLHAIHAVIMMREEEEKQQEEERRRSGAFVAPPSPKRVRRV